MSFPPKVTFAGYPGFDIGVYPGDAALTAWRYPTSPYHWVGYYLTAAAVLSLLGLVATHETKNEQL